MCHYPLTVGKGEGQGSSNHPGIRHLTEGIRVGVVPEARRLRLSEELSGIHDVMGVEQTFYAFHKL
jgi:hypothetical protein